MLPAFWAGLQFLQQHCLYFLTTGIIAYSRTLTGTKPLQHYLRVTHMWNWQSMTTSYLTAGPIERATHLLPQIKQERHFDYVKAVDGLRQILWGLFKKIVVLKYTQEPEVDTNA